MIDWVHQNSGGPYRRSRFVSHLIRQRRNHGRGSIVYCEQPSRQLAQIGAEFMLGQTRDPIARSGFCLNWVLRMDWHPIQPIF